MTYSLREFIPKYFDLSIVRDAAWRAYDIERMATLHMAKKALKELGYSELNRFGFEQVAHDYKLAHAAQAQQILALWFTWLRIARGDTIRGKLRKDRQ